MLPEDRLQMKWRESDGSGLGYLVQVKPMAGKGLCPPASVRTGGDSGRLCVSVSAHPCDWPLQAPAVWAHSRRRAVLPTAGAPDLHWGKAPVMLPGEAVSLCGV